MKNMAVNTKLNKARYITSHYYKTKLKKNRRIIRVMFLFFLDFDNQRWLGQLKQTRSMRPPKIPTITPTVKPKILFINII